MHKQPFKAEFTFGRAVMASLPSAAPSLRDLDRLRDLDWPTLRAYLYQLPALTRVREIVWRYFKASHQDDPFRTILELLLVFFVIRTWTQSRTRGESSGKNFVKLSEKVRADWVSLSCDSAEAMDRKSMSSYRSGSRRA